MKKTALTAIAATAVFGVFASTAEAEGDQDKAQPKVNAAAVVYAPLGGMTYSVGSNGFLGFFLEADGKCALTMMLFEKTDAEGKADPSAAKVQVLIWPGENARIASAEGQSLELTCGFNAKTVTVAQVGYDVASR